MLDDLLAAAGLDVQVDVRRAAAPRGQEAFEEHLVAHGVHGGDPQGVADGGVGGGPASLAQDAGLPAELDDVADDEEVAGEVEGLDDLELVVDHPPGVGVGRAGAVTLDGAAPGELTQPGGRGVPGRDLGGGQAGNHESQVEGEVRSEVRSDVDGVGGAAVEADHVSRSAQPASQGGQVPGSGLEVEVQAGGGQDVGEVGVGGAGAADGPGGDQRQVGVVGERGEGVGQGGVGRAAVEGELDPDVVRTEQIHQLVQAGAGGRQVPAGGVEAVVAVGRRGVAAQGTAQGPVGGAGQDEPADGAGGRSTEITELPPVGGGVGGGPVGGGR